MHSRLFVLRPVVEYDGNPVKLPSMDDRSCVTEDELADSFVGTYADYVDLIDHKLVEEWKDSSEWLTSCYKCMSLSKENGETFVTLDVSKGRAILEDNFNRFKEVVASIDSNEFADPWSMKMYEMQHLIDDKTGFWVIIIDDGWYYESMDSFLRSYCCNTRKQYQPLTYKFRLEDIFDYHN